MQYNLYFNTATCVAQNLTNGQVTYSTPADTQWTLWQAIHAIINTHTLDLLQELVKLQEIGLRKISHNHATQVNCFTLKSFIFVLLNNGKYIWW